MATGGYKQMANQIQAFELLLPTLGMAMPKNFPMRGYLDLVSEFLADHAASPDAAGAKWKERDFHEWYKAMIAVDKLVSVASRDGKPAGKAPAGSSSACAGPRHLSGLRAVPGQELLVRAGSVYLDAEGRLRGRAGGTRHPAAGNGLTGPFGIACKFPASEKNSMAGSPKGITRSNGRASPASSRSAWT